MIKFRPTPKEILEICSKLRLEPVFYFRYNLINKLSTFWLFELINILKKEFGSNKFKVCVEVQKDYALFINLIEEKIDYIKFIANKEMTKKLQNIARENKVFINPNFSILDLSKVKNIKKKIIKLI